MSLETILPFLQPIEHVLLDPDVSEAMVNGDGSIFMQRSGELSLVNAVLDPKYLASAVKRIARSLGNDISERKLLLGARLADGSRVAAAFPPCSLCGVTLMIRKFRPHWFTMQQLVEFGALPAELGQRLAEAVLHRKTILIAGGTDTGKNKVRESADRPHPATGTTSIHRGHGGVEDRSSQRVPIRSPKRTDRQLRDQNHSGRDDSRPGQSNSPASA